MNKRIQQHIKKRVYNIKKHIIFKSSHISFGGKIGLLGVVICFVSLFFPWVFFPETIISSENLRIDTYTSFSNVMGWTGLFITLTLAIIVFALFSIQKKEKFRYFSLIHISDYISLLAGSIFIFLLSLHSFFLIGGLRLFSSNVVYGKGIALCITGSFVIFAGAMIMKQEYRKNIKGSYINDVKTQAAQQGSPEEKNNMKLPF